MVIIIRQEIWTFQNESKNANSSFGEAFTYSLEGLVGSDWRKQGTNKSFTMTFTFKGANGSTITLGKLESAKPNYEVPKALPSNVKGKIPGYDFDGDSTFDVEALKNDDTGYSYSTTLHEHQWLALPYSRVVVHLEFDFDKGIITPLSDDLDLEFGIYHYTESFFH